MTAAGAAASGIDPALDHHFMQIAFALGRRERGRTWPNPAVGAVIVRDTRDGPITVGRGWTQPGGRPHAETEALRRAGAAARGATMYATLEPCSHYGKTPPCADAIAAAGIARVVIPMQDPNPQVAGSGVARLRRQGIVVDVGLGVAEARREHSGHISRMQRGRPHVLLKLAVSADEKAGLAGRKPAAITGAEARTFVHRLRAESDAVLTGIGTVLADDPQLTCRLPGMADRSPVRVVLDRELRFPPDARLLATANETPVWIVTGEDASAGAEQKLRSAGAEIFRAPATAGRIDVEAALRLVAERGITRVMVEAGPILSAAFTSARLVDEAVLLRGPNPLGLDAIAALESMPLTALTGMDGLHRVEDGLIGADRFERYERF